jgi:hypothetical protein
MSKSEGGAHAGLSFNTYLRTGPQPLPKRALYTVRSSASSISFHYLSIFLRSPSSCLRLLPRLPVTGVYRHLSQARICCYKANSHYYTSQSLILYFGNCPEDIWQPTSALRITGVLAKIWTGHFPNASVQPYRCTNLFRRTRPKRIKNTFSSTTTSWCKSLHISNKFRWNSFSGFWIEAWGEMGEHDLHITPQFLPLGAKNSYHMPSTSLRSFTEKQRHCGELWQYRYRTSSLLTCPNRQECRLR